MKIISGLVAVFLMILTTFTWAGERQTFNLTLTEQGFVPSQLEVPAHEKIEIRMYNATKKLAEFESFDMKFEKIAPPAKTISVLTGPLKPGEYLFFDDYSAQDAKGKVISKVRLNRR